MFGAAEAVESGKGALGQSRSWRNCLSRGAREGAARAGAARARELPERSAGAARVQRERPGAARAEEQRRVASGCSGERKN